MDIKPSKEDVENFELLSVLTQNNPGACNIVIELIKNIEGEELSIFFNKIIIKNILGARLWYIYKNECNHNIRQLVEKDLTPFNDKYFYEKFEKFI